MALALIAAIDHCLAATSRAKAAGESIEYKPMAFLPEWAYDGGRTGTATLSLSLPLPVFCSLSLSLSPLSLMQGNRSIRSKCGSKQW